MDQDLPEQVEGEATKKSNSFEEASEPDIKIDKNEEASDHCEMEQYEFIKDFSIKDSSVSDGNDTETSSFGVINSENEVKN